MPNIGGLLKKGAQKGIQGVKTGARKAKEAGQAIDRIGRNHPRKVSGGLAIGIGGGLGAAGIMDVERREELWALLEETGRLEELGELEEESLRELQEDDPERFTAIMFKHGHRLGGAIPRGDM